MTNDRQDKGVRLGFERESVVVPLTQLVPLKVMRPGTKESQKYAQVLTSVRAVGLVEAPVVTPDPKHRGQYFLLDGHLRVEVLKELGVADVECLVATDDETYTYNKRIDPAPRLPSVIRRACSGGDADPWKWAEGCAVGSGRRYANLRGPPVIPFRSLPQGLPMIGKLLGHTQVQTGPATRTWPPSRSSALRNPQRQVRR